MNVALSVLGAQVIGMLLVFSDSCLLSRGTIFRIYIEYVLNYLLLFTSSSKSYHYLCLLKHELVKYHR